MESARALARHSNLQVTLVTDRTTFEYYPASFRAFSTGVTYRNSIPLKDFRGMKNVDIIIDRVERIDPDASRVYTTHNGAIDADYIVVAAGSEVAYFDIPGVRETTLPFRSGADAADLRRHIDGLFATYHTSPAAEQVIAFRFVIVGGGPAGCEVAAEVAQYTHELTHTYGVSHDVVSVDLVEGRERILNMLPQSFSERASHRLESLGVHIMPFRNLVSSTDQAAVLSDATLRTRTIVWTAGVQTAEIVQSSDWASRSVRGRFDVDEHLTVHGCDNVYAVGDVAGTSMAGLAQVALYDGDFVARDIIARIADTMRPIYVSPSAAHIVALGSGYGLLQVGTWIFSGWIGAAARWGADMMYFLTRVKLKTFIRIVLGTRLK